MGSKYIAGNNVIQDFLLESILLNINISQKKLKTEILRSFINIIENALDNPNDALYLDFDIIKKNEFYRLVANNSISALWLSGIYPIDYKSIIGKNVFRIGNIEYKFNTKTKRLSHKIIKS